MFCIWAFQVRKLSTWSPCSLSFRPLGVSPLMHMLTSVLSRCCHFCRVVTILILVFSTLTTILFSSHQLDIPCRSLFSFSSISSTFFPQALMVESSAYMSTLHIVLVLMGMSFINTIKSSGPKIVVIIDNGEVTALTLLDLSSAFDTIVHDILITRLSTWYGIFGIALSWFTASH